uniref:Poly A polymerase head domain-containing protein n=1 Tax=Chenopodium quinoa TaxID=63459 RepID=A0A803M3A2_CHEQI
MASEPHFTIQVKDQIHLTEKESLIFKRLKDVLHHFNLDTQLRVAGGWVRDKLLGKDCYDIDVAIDNMLGREFCEKINEYLLKTGEDVQGIGVIQCNPDQSKHLETARMRLLDLWIDFVNLRAEDYRENSRIPTMRFGTPEEDAYRRDLTINRFCLAFMDTALRLIQSLESLNLNDEQRRLCLYSALFLPLRSMVYRDNKKKKVPVVDFIFRNSLKLKSKDAETVSSDSLGLMILLRLCYFAFWDVQHAEAHCGKILIDVPETLKLQILAGLLLREIKDFWPVALLVSTLLYPNGDLCESLAEDLKLEKNKVLFKQVKDVVLKLDLENIWEAKPLVNGKDIMSILNLKAGPNVKEWQQKVIEWQLAHPTGTADECQEWLREAGAKRARMDDNV